MAKGKLKVTVSLSNGLHPMWVTPNGITFNDAFIDSLYEEEEYFRERIILQINELAGDNWSVHFTEKPVQKRTYLVDINAEDSLVPAIVRIVSNAFPEFNLDFWRPAHPYRHLGSRSAVLAE